MRQANSGKSGSVRVETLDATDLSAMEKHGQREDASGQARRVSDDEPLVHGGLDIVARCEKHVEGRKQQGNRHALRAELEKSLFTKPASEWVKALNALGVPSGAVLTVPQVLDDPQLKDRGMIADVSIGTEQVQVSAAPVLVEGVRPAPKSSPPTLGQHNVEVWTEAGLSAGEISALQNEGVI